MALPSSVGRKRPVSQLDKPFLISVRDLENKFHNLEIHASDMVMTLKSKMSSFVAIPPTRQSYTFEGTALRDEKTMAHYGIVKDCTLMLTRTKLDDAKRYPIVLRREDGSECMLEVASSDTVAQIKRRIADTNFPFNRQHFAFRGTALRNHQTLAECGLVKNSLVETSSLKEDCPRSVVRVEFGPPDALEPKHWYPDRPDVRKLQKGFNLEGICRNKKCKFFGKRAWANLGFKYSRDDFDRRHLVVGFDVCRVIHAAPCPLCREFLDYRSVTGCGFEKCAYSFEGYRSDLSKIVRRRGEAQQTESFEYHNGEKDGPTWTYLIVAVKPLKR